MRKLGLLLLMSVFVLGSAVADEGMWLPSLVHKLNMDEMQKMGLELSAEDIYNINGASLKDAIGALDHGSCTAELISPDGLLLTNHHCAFGEIQSHSTVEHDYLQDGFWAMNHEEELPNPGKTVSFVVRMEEVTDEVLADVTEDMSENERNRKINSVSGRLERQARGDTHYETYVRSFFDNNRYFLFVVETFKDVRLVGAPPQALGKFGGDTDNWMWPRHTADFALFRVYTGPDGKPAQYSEENVPYNPDYYLPVSIKGIEEGDFAMVMGFPGTTNRYKTSFGVNYTMQVTNPVRIEVREKKLGILEDYMSSSQKARIQYASKYARSSNYYKYSIGQNKGLNDLKVVVQKEALEDEFRSWVNSDKARVELYGEALDLIEEAYRDIDDDKAREYLAEAMLRGPDIFMFAYRAAPLYSLLENEKVSDERVKTVAGRIKETIDDYFKDYHAETDQMVVAELLELYAENNDRRFYPDFMKEIMDKRKPDFSKYAEKMFKKSIFDDKEELTEFLNDPDFKTLKKDMVFQAAKDIFDKYREITEITEEQNEKLAIGRRLFVAGLTEMEKEKNFYPDANSTLRLTYGKVLNYEPRDGVIYKYYTTTDGYIEKEIPGDDEFHVPEKLKKMLLAQDFGRYMADDGNLYACFITNNDITGGNSGSPVLNGNGELIGVAFDGNWEAMSGDIAFEPELQRCINVDIRFVLWIIDKYAGATHLIEEMKIVE
ncbi:MAG: S46 family peptidase [Prolixibacteraceae bacterium]